MKKICLITLLCFSLLILASCGNRDEIIVGEQIQKEKTQLYVSNYDGGIGTEWLYKIKKIYEELHKDDSYEPGKKGLQIIVDANKNGGPSVIETFSTSTTEIMFNEGVSYNQWVAKDLFLDITDVVQSKCDGEDYTIESKLDSDQQSFLKKNGKYYALPHYAVYQGVTYNIDLFDKKGFYFSKDVDNGNDGFVVKGDEKSCGPDGIYGTYDDGLPSSYEEFFKLCDYMVERGVTPFVWTGQYSKIYSSFILDNIYQTYEGKEDAMLNYTFDSGNNTTEIVKSISNGNLITENVKITPENGYLVRQQPGRYYAIEFLSKILSNSSYYHPFSTGNLTFSHTDAQEVYYESELKNQPIAFLIEGTWWENEAKLSGAIDRAVNKYGDVALNRHFGIMPMPKLVTGRVEEGQGSKPILMDTIESFVGINKNIASYKIDLAKDFLKFCYSDEMLEKFTAISGITKGVKYSMSEEALAQMTNYAKNVWVMRTQSQVFTANTNNDFYMRKESVLSAIRWDSTVNGRTETAFTQIRYGEDPVSIFLGNFIDSETWYEKYYK